MERNGLGDVMDLRSIGVGFTCGIGVGKIKTKVQKMRQLTLEEIKKLGSQEKLQFGTRVEVNGVKGIVNHCSREMCRVFYGFGKFIESHPSKLRILSPEESVGV